MDGRFARDEDMENANSEKLFECVVCGEPMTLGIFCTIECAVEYGASDGEKWIIEDKVLDKIKRKEYIES